MSAIKNNIIETKKLLYSGQKFCLVVKANAYGLGSKRICKETNEIVDYFAVSSPEEFFAICEVAKKPILVLDPVYKKSDIKKLIKNKAKFTISNFENLKVLIELSEKVNEKVELFFAINTGMNRFGFSKIEEVKKAINIIKKTQNISILGAFSHYFEANNEKFSKIQFSKFENLIEPIKQTLDNKLIFHIANSDGLKNINGFDMVRVGISAYVNNSYNTITLKSKIIEFQNLDVGESSGYNRVFIAPKKTRLAIVSIGYGDGIPRSLQGRGYVLVNGKFSKIVAVCMDSILIDVSDIQCKIYDDVILIGNSGKNHIFVCDFARMCDTISYEILVHIQSRVKRKYVHTRSEKCK